MDSAVPSGEPKNVLMALPRLVPNGPGESRSGLRDLLHFFEPRRENGGPADRIAAIALKAGLFLWHDDLDESHALSQSIEGKGAHQLGDYWHAILHRREPDYSNAKYWFRQISPHTIYPQLLPIAGAVLSESSAPDAKTWQERLTRNGSWAPLAFVDLCENCAPDEDSPLALTARTIQWAEMILLLALNQSEL